MVIGLGRSETTVTNSLFFKKILFFIFIIQVLVNYFIHIFKF